MRGYHRFITITALTWLCALGPRDCVRSACADELIIESKPIANIRIVNISEGEITYLLGTAERHRPIETSIVTLTDVPALADAEVAWSQGNADGAFTAWRAAAETADIPWQKAWVLFRLSINLDATGRYTESASAWAELIVTQPDSYWALAAPVGQPDHPDATTQAQALAALEKARNHVENTRLRPLINELITTISELSAAPERETRQEPEVHEPDRQPEHPDDIEPVESGSAPEPEPKTPLNATKQPTAAAEPVATDPAWQRVVNEVLESACRERPVNEASKRVLVLMRQRQWPEALAELETLAANPGSYPLDRLLFEYGWALSEVGQTRVACVRLMQCAILFESSGYAYWSLIRCAWVYRYRLADNRTADMLLQMARDISDTAGPQELVPSRADIAALQDN